jgi:hypothetical protein
MLDFYKLVRGFRLVKSEAYIATYGKTGRSADEWLMEVTCRRGGRVCLWSKSDGGLLCYSSVGRTYVKALSSYGPGVFILRESTGGGIDWGIQASEWSKVAPLIGAIRSRKVRPETRKAFKG